MSSEEGFHGTRGEYVYGPQPENGRRASGSNDGESDVSKLPRTQGASLSPSFMCSAVAVLDCLCVAISGLGIYLWYVGWDSQVAPLYASIIALSTVLVLSAFHLSGLYDFQRLTQPSGQYARILLCCAIAFMAVGVIAFGFKISDRFSRVWAFSWFFSMLLLLVGTRRLGFNILQAVAKRGLVSRNIAILGAGENGERLIRHIQERREPWLHVVGLFDDRRERVPERIGDLPVLGDLNQLVRHVRLRRIDEVFISLPWSAHQRISSLIERLSELPVHVRLSSDLVGFAYPNSSYSTQSGIPMLDIVTRPMSDWNSVLKRSEDLVIASLSTLFFLPVMAIIALAIKLDSKGPVLFLQPRYGFNNRTFGVYKFRTMYHGRAAELGVPQATRDDSRVTRIGRILRRTSLDELPQLFNVLQGSMSLVGPRPHAVEHNEKYALLIDRYFARHRVKPGLTGWAQINGFRGETNTDQKMMDRVKLDLSYIENWTLLFDLRILLKTALVAWISEDAY